VRSAVRTYHLLGGKTGSAKPVSRFAARGDYPSKPARQTRRQPHRPARRYPLGAARSGFPAHRRALLHTLRVFSEYAENQTMTARRLGLRRSSLYQWLERIERVLGVAVDDARLHPILRLSCRLPTPRYPGSC